jgi:HTH-type transcriptional regulator / antitoxin HipB
MHDHADSVSVWAAAVRQRRTTLHMRQDDLAALAGVSTRFVHAVETGKPSLQLEKLLLVLHVLGLRLQVTGPGLTAEIT